MVCNSGSFEILIILSDAIDRSLLHWDVAGQSKPTTLQTASVIEWQTLLAKCIGRFHEIQETYMPGINAQVFTHTLHSAQPSTKSTRTSSTSTTASIHIISYFSHPNSHVSSVRTSARMISHLQRKDFDIPKNLEKVCHQLCTHTFTNQFKIKNVTGQRLNTRSYAAQGTIDEGVKLSQMRYTQACTALFALGPGKWENTLQVLISADVQGLSECGLTDLEKAEEQQIHRTVCLPKDEEEIDNIIIIAKLIKVREGH